MTSSPPRHPESSLDSPSPDVTRLGLTRSGSGGMSVRGGGAGQVSSFRSLKPLDLRCEESRKAAIPLGPEGAVLHGRLDNGVTYYVRRNAKPQHRAALALAIRRVRRESGWEGTADLSNSQTRFCPFLSPRLSPASRYPPSAIPPSVNPSSAIRQSVIPHPQSPIGLPPFAFPHSPSLIRLPPFAIPQSAVSHPPSPIRHIPFPFPHSPSPIRLPRFAIPQSAIPHPPSPLRVPPSAIPHPPSPICLPHSARSLAEEEVERGVAHVLEHLAFPATRLHSNQHVVLAKNTLEFSPKPSHFSPTSLPLPSPSAIRHPPSPARHPSSPIRHSRPCRSLAEEEAERGVAHILEHLAFSATRRYSNHDIVRFLESIGAEFGACQNAYTSADETVFELQLPVDKPELLPHAISILADFASEVSRGSGFVQWDGMRVGVSLSSCSAVQLQVDRPELLPHAVPMLADFDSEIRVSEEDVEKERGAVLEEWRERRNAMGRMQDAHWQLLMQGSKYAERLPIGLESVIRGVPAAAVKRFYHTWYHPANMAVVAVGDFPDAQAVVALIAEYFAAKLPLCPSACSAVPEEPFHPHSQPRFSVFVEREAGGSAVMVTCKAPVHAMVTPMDYRQYLVEELFQAALSHRLFLLSRRPNPPFYAAAATVEALVKSSRSFSLSASCQDKGTLKALEALWMEVARVQVHGISDRELAMARVQCLADVESAYVEREQTYSEALREEYLAHFLKDEPSPGIEYEARLAKALLPVLREEYLAHFLKDEPSPGIEYEARLAKALLPAFPPLLPFVSPSLPCLLPLASPSPASSLPYCPQASQRQRWQQCRRKYPPVTAVWSRSWAHNPFTPYALNPLPLVSASRPAGITAAEVAAVASEMSPSSSCVVKIVEAKAHATVEAIQGVINRVMQAKEATVAAMRADEAAKAAVEANEAAKAEEAKGAAVKAKEAADAVREEEESAGAVESGGGGGEKKGGGKEGNAEKSGEGGGEGDGGLEGGGGVEGGGEGTEATATTAGTATAAAGGGEAAAAAAGGGEGEEAVELIEPWTLDDIPESIVQTPPVPGEVEERREYPGVGVTELRLSNGMRVAVKCTDFLDDQILISGYAYGGLSEVSEVDYYTAAMAQSIAGEAGIFGHPPAVMAELLAGKRVEVGGKLSSYMRVFSGECSPDDLETALQLVYQLFTCSIRAEAKDIALIKQMTREAVRGQQRDPFAAFANRVREISYGRSYQFKPITESDLRRVDYSRACEYFERAFKDPSPFTAVIVGSTRLEQALPLIKQYLGGIPVPRPAAAMPRYERDSLTALPFNFPDSLIREEVRRVMVEAQGYTQITFPLNIPASPKVVEETMWVGFLTKLLETRVMQLLRFKHGQIYTVSASSFLGGARPSRDGGVRGDLAVAFSCDPTTAWSLVDLSVAEIERVQREGPEEADVKTARELEQRAHEMGLQENSFWLDRVVRAYQTRLYDGNVDESFQALEDIRLRLISQLSTDSVRTMLTQLLPVPCSKQYTAVSLVPTQPLWRRLLSLPPKQNPGLTSESK
ncbi:unnamed protein product, partial [Closterium sp. NIES-53]